MPKKTRDYDTIFNATKHKINMRYEKLMQVAARIDMSVNGCRQ